MKTNKKNRRKSLPTMLELFLEAPSAMIVSAHGRSGAGLHQDKRRKKERKHDWKKDSD
jgi:hypothetical protein